MMISNISQLAANVWSPMTFINNTKPSNPIIGSVFHDIGTGKTYAFNVNSWTELKIHDSDVEFNKKRMRKIENLFKI